MQRQLVDYALARRSTLARLRAGQMALSDVCDGDTYLLRAAKFHGQITQRPCPVCRKEQVTLVSWVFGGAGGAPSGTARTDSEITALATSSPEFTVHVVEVCRTCRWNYLVQSYVAGVARPEKKPRPATKRRRVAK
ncbi:DUF5318 domain-containing protein [Gordonia sp. HY285]|uniref:DUF5318 family protein n=1 Tax=Gordonia liuliyuniae TaxID=2911517 RepID=UPI001F323FE2|nr:DUF5318 family protein [Gordonia liuliyuniae]MCF8609137.1 DUF5318 domain-containing protein [Gordonia liuliyuniae]